MHRLFELLSIIALFALGALASSSVTEFVARAIAPIGAALTS